MMVGIGATEEVAWMVDFNISGLTIMLTTVGRCRVSIQTEQRQSATNACAAKERGWREDGRRRGCQGSSQKKCGGTNGEWEGAG